MLEKGGALVPVPMHRSKRRARGYNPSELIAEELARLSCGKVIRLLRKTRETASQSTLPLVDRHVNVRGSFALQRRRTAPPRVVLVDDVATSGETLGECARVLFAGGAREVSAVTVAKTLRER